MSQQNRAVTPVISTILVVAIVVILAATVSVAFLGITENLAEPAPLISDTTGEFDAGSGGDRQIVRITHVAGDSVEVEDIEIIVRASGPDSDLPTEARLVNLPADVDGFCTNGRLTRSKNIEGDYDLIQEGCPNRNGPFPQVLQVITDADSNTWSPGRTIQFQIRSDRADFSPGGEADELEVIIVHTPSKAIISEHVFRP